MKSLILKVTGYLSFSYLLYFLIIYATNKEAKFIKLSDLQSGKDFFYFFWLFGIPLLIEFIFIGLPLVYGLKKISHSSNKSPFFYFFFILLFFIEYLIESSIYGIQSTTLKVSISIVVFVILFWKRMF